MRLPCSECQIVSELENNPEVWEGDYLLVDEAKSREILEKSVDLIDSPHLKYKSVSPRHLLSIAGSGFFTGPTAFVHERKREYMRGAPIPPMSLGEMKKKIKERMAVQKKELYEGSTHKVYESGVLGWDKGGYSKQANVWYPEGALTFLQQQLLGVREGALEAFESEKIAVQATGEWYLHLVLEDFFSSPEDVELFEREMKKMNVDFSVLKDLPEWRGYNSIFFAAIDKYGENIEQFRKEIGRKILSSDVIWNRICQRMRIIFLESTIYMSVGGDYGVMVVLDADTEVKLSYHPDYIAQATLWGTRAKPDHFKGLLVNAMYWEDPLFVKSWRDLQIRARMCGLPIYNNKGDIIWPRHILRSEIDKTKS